MAYSDSIDLYALSFAYKYLKASIFSKNTSISFLKLESKAMTPFDSASSLVLGLFSDTPAPHTSCPFFLLL